MWTALSDLKKRIPSLFFFFFFPFAFVVLYYSENFKEQFVPSDITRHKSYTYLEKLKEIVFYKRIVMVFF